MLNQDPNKRNERRKSEINAVKELGEKIGYGNVMSIASALWGIDLINVHKLPVDGAFVPAGIIDIFPDEKVRYEAEQELRMKEISRLLSNES